MSPVVWADIRQRLLAVAVDQSIAPSLFQWPNEDFTKPTTGTLWIAVEFNANHDAPIEMGAGTWRETGNIWLNFMVPKGAGVSDALVTIEQFGLAFRDVNDAPAGLFYRAQSLDPIDQSAENGVFNRFTKLIEYDFQNRKVS